VVGSLQPPTSFSRDVALELEHHGELGHGGLAHDGLPRGLRVGHGSDEEARAGGRGERGVEAPDAVFADHEHEAVPRRVVVGLVRRGVERERGIG
jgi:hypothetical protein